MGLVTPAGLLVGAAVLLAVGAELFAKHAASAGRRLRVSGLAVGLLLAGAEPEELVTAVVAALRDQPGVAAGDAIGANITLLTLILGGLALVTPLTLARRGTLYAAAAAGTGAAAWATLADGLVGRAEGGVLVVVYLALVAVFWWRERELPAIGELSEVLEDADDQTPASRGLVLAVVGIAFMGAGGWVAVLGAERVIDLLGVAGSVVGLTLVALATTSEFVALIPAAVRRGIPELAAAGIVGSVIYNATVTLGAAAAAQPLHVAGLSPAATTAALLPAAIAAAAGGHGRIGRPLGIALVAGYACYVWFVWR